MFAGACLFVLLPIRQDGAPVDPYGFERARSAVIRSAVDRAAPGIVKIETIGGAQPVRAGAEGPAPESFRLGEGPTTGLIFSADGWIITSSINFAREPAVITVTLADRRRFVARLAGRDHIRRLALLRIEADGLTPVEWAPRTDLQIGQYAIACGWGLGGSAPSVSLGILSALNRRNGNALQTDAKVSPVNYGGPLIDIEGRVIGILVPMAGLGGALAGAEWYDSGIGFAIYRDKIDYVMDRLAAGEDIEPGKIGVILKPAEEEESLFPLLDKFLPPVKGVEVGAVAEPSPASRSGLKVGDKILAVDGLPTGDLLELQRRLSDRAAGEEITLTIKRRWRRIDLKIKLAKISEIGRVRPPDDSEDTERDEPTRREATPTTRPTPD